MKQGPFAPDGLCCPDRHHYYDPLRLPLDRPPLPGITGYKWACFPGSQPGAEEGLSSSQDNLLTIPRPLTPEGSSTFAPGPRTSSMAFAQRQRARLPLVPPEGGAHHDVADFASCCGLASRHPLNEVSSLRFDAKLSLDAGSQLPGTLASPRTGLTPVG